MKIPRSFILFIIPLIILTWTGMATNGPLALSESKDEVSGINHALIIGIGNYANWSKLSSPPQDAKEIARILTEKYNFKKENVTLLTDNSKEKPTLVTIVTYFDKYVNELTENDNLLIFYSGHSSDDEDGNTYWIPIDAQKKLKVTWINHTDVCDEYIGSDNFKAKNVLILTDSLFTKNLLKPASLSLSPFDLRYQEKIREKARRKSRELISFGDKHWPGSDATDGYGLFAYYFRKALMNNWFKVIDLENLMFDEEILFQIRKIAGTRLIRGRLKNSSMDKGGQSIITRVISPPPINITDAYVNPKKGFAGDKFIIGAVTNRPAFEVYVELKGKKYLMDGDGTEWKHSIKVASIGKSSFSVLAINEDDVSGKIKEGQLETIRPLTGMVNVSASSVSPKKGTGGDEFTFTAKTDAAADKVVLVINGKRYYMTGSGTEWSLKKQVDETGSVAYSIAALNKDGIEGRVNGGTMSIEAPEVRIVNLLAPDEGFAGDKFLITANTDHPARSVELKLGDKTYAMEGSGKEWSLKKDIPEIGKFSIVAMAKNMDGKTGQPTSREIVTTKRPAEIPDILTVSLSPEKPKAGEDFSLKVKTSAEAEVVSLELAGKKIPMQGSGTEWRYTTQIPSVGSTDYRIIATNKDGKQGRPKEDKITTIQKTGIEVVRVDVSPKTGNQGQTFTFKATTNEPAGSVSAVIGEKTYRMSGSGTNWSFATKINDLGTINFYIVASDDKGVKGSSKTGNFTTNALLANVVRTNVSAADKGFAGEEFLITAFTDNPAQSVSLNMDGITYDMEGTGKEWQLKRAIHDTGKKTFTIIAKNIEGANGKSGKGEILVKTPIPDVAEVSFSTQEIFAEEDFTIKVKTSVDADKALVEIAGKRIPMIGAGTDWTLSTRIAQVGMSNYKVLALNKDGQGGFTKEGAIQVAKKPAPFVNVATAEVSPEKGYSGGSFNFVASTDRSAQKVVLSIGGQDFDMKGSGTNWSLDQKISRTGSLDFSIIAINEDNVEGAAKTASFTVQKITERYTYNKDGTITDKVTGEVKKRFKDNGDGTVTDLATNLMWLQSPKRIAVSFEEAEEYCRELNTGGFSGWRLPTYAEWKNFIDKSHEAPALPLGHPFRDLVTHELYWSKTRSAKSSQRIAVVDLYTGKIDASSINKQYITWPVRYAETGE